MPFFELQHTDKNSRARAGVIHTDHGDIETPVFMPVGTQATVKTLDQADLEMLDAQIILGNTYHLHLRPGENLIAELGGLHRFMNWARPMLTDSGGFQVFSLGTQKTTVIARSDEGATPQSPISRTNLALKNQGITTSADPLRRNFSEASANRLPRDDATKQSQARLVSIDNDGVTFRSHIDGSTHRFTPEASIEIQHKLGADIIMAFDECTPDDDDYFNSGGYDYIKEAMERTHRWAERSLAEHSRLNAVILSEAKNPSHGRRDPSVAPLPQDDKRKHKRYIFGIIQGANYENLRKESAKFISSLDFDGIAIGGESIGYNMELTAQILDWVYPIIPENKPHYTMGVGLSPADLLIAVEHGADMFDCVGPTRLARHGMVFCFDPKNKHRLNIKNAKFTKDAGPIDAICDCSTCRNYSRAYVHHLFSADEMTGMRLASIHNLRFMIKLMEEARAAIKNDSFDELKRKWI